jgi:putative ABC transport system substrate-binding protein
MKKKIIIKFLLLVTIGFVNKITFANEKLLITVNQFVKHDALDAAYDGFYKALSDRKVLELAEIIVANAQGSVSNSIQIAKHQASLMPAFMVGISTPSAQSILKSIDKDNSTLAFVAVTDPKAANLIRDGVIGVSDVPPIKELLEIIRKIFPNKKIIGVIYNSGEINSIKMIEKLELEAPKLDFEIKKIAVNNSSDIKMAMTKVADMSDIIYLPQDNTIISAVDSIVSIAKSTKKPLIANDPLLVEKGVFLALGTNYFKSGEKLGNLIADRIEGREVLEKIISSDSRELKINESVVKDLGIIIPENINKEIDK